MIGPLNILRTNHLRGFLFSRQWRQSWITDTMFDPSRKRVGRTATHGGPGSIDDLTISSASSDQVQINPDISDMALLSQACRRHLRWTLHRRHRFLISIFTSTYTMCVVTRHTIITWHTRSVWRLPWHHWSFRSGGRSHGATASLFAALVASTSFQVNIKPLPLNIWNNTHRELTKYFPGNIVHAHESKESSAAMSYRWTRSLRFLFLIGRVQTSSVAEYFEVCEVLSRDNILADHMERVLDRLWLACRG